MCVLHGNLSTAEEICPFTYLILDIISTACSQNDFTMIEKGLLSISDMRHFHKKSENIKKACIEGTTTIQRANEMLKSSGMDYSSILLYLDR